MTGVMDHSETKAKVFTDENYNEVKRIALRYFPNDADAKDLAQELFMRVLDLVESNAFEWTGRGQFMKWCHITVRNMALAQLRSERRHRILAKENCMPVLSDVMTDISPEAASALGEQLSDNQRRYYVLHYLEGQDYQEIARSQGLAVSTVQSQCSRAKKAICKTLL